MKEGWQTKTLGDIADVKGGKRIPKGYQLQTERTDHPYITVSNFTDEGTIDISNIKYISDEAFEQMRRYIISSQDLYLSIAGTIGKTGYVPDELDGANLTENACKLVLHPGIDRNFLFYFTKSADFAEQVAANTRIAAQPKLALERLKTIRLCFPPHPEQRRIVAILDEAFAGIARGRANTEKNLQNARALFESYLQSVFTQRGEEWVEKRLGEMSERITKGSSPKWQGIAYTDRPGILFITSENVSEYQIMLDQPKYVEERFNKREKKSILKKGDVLTNIVGASIGRTAVFDRDEVANINQAVCLIRCEPDLLNNFFLTYLLNSPLFKQVLHDNEVNNARANLSLGFFSHLLVPTPPIPVQSKIVAKVGALRAETQRLESIYQRKLAALDELKKSLLQQAFSGEL